MFYSSASSNFHNTRLKDTKGGGFNGRDGAPTVMKKMRKTGITVYFNPGGFAENGCFYLHTDVYSPTGSFPVQPAV